MTKPNDRRPRPAATARPSAVITLMFGLLIAPVQACAQQPGTGAVVSLRLSRSAEPVQGWSVKHGLLGRPVYASVEGKQIGTVLDLVVTPGAAPFVLIIGAAGALEIGGHSVAVPIADVMEQSGVLILPNATRTSLKAMPRFTYAKAAVHRAEYIRTTSAQLAEANALLLTRTKKAAAEAGAEGTELALDNVVLQSDITAAEDKLSDLEKAELSRWIPLRVDVDKAMARVLVAMPHPATEPTIIAPRRP